MADADDPRAESDDVLAAEEALEEGRVEDAVDLAERALRADPSSTDASLVLGSALMELGHPGRALDAFDAGLLADPDDSDLKTMLAAARFTLGEAARAATLLESVVARVPEHPDAHYWLSLIVERQGDYERADALLKRAHELDPEAYALPTRIERTELEELLAKLLDTLPAPIREALDEVPIIVEDLPPDELLAGSGEPLAPDLLGLFVGAAMSEESVFDHQPPMSTVYLFQRNLERTAESREELIEEARVTLVHEIGHYLGLSEDALDDRDLG